MEQPLVSFVIPCYRSRNTICPVVDEIRTQFATQSKYTYQIILVCDASPDDTFEVIQQICAEDPKVLGMLLARNFGQQAAMMAGFKRVKGEYTIIMDDDGQHPPEGIFVLIKELEMGSDVAIARFPDKKHTAFQRFGSWINDIMAVALIGKPKDLKFSSFFAVRRFVLESLLLYTTPRPYILGYCLQITKHIVNVKMDHRLRLAGTSGYTFGKMISLWLSGFTSFSVKPLRIASGLGVCTAIAGFLYAIVLIVRKLLEPAVPLGYASTMAAILLIGGAVMALLGMLGEYVGRIFMTLNKLPQYTVREEILQHPPGEQ